LASLAYSQTNREASKPKTSPDKEAAVMKVVEAYIDIWNQKDAKAWTALFAGDADFTNRYGLHLKGRADIEKLHTELFRGVLKDVRLNKPDASNTYIRFITSDVATVDYRWETPGPLDQQGNRLPSVKGKTQMTIARDKAHLKNGWSIVAMNVTEFRRPDDH
jgi:uncharacterized protein (TIGR02246 family)